MTVMRTVGWGGKADLLDRSSQALEMMTVSITVSQWRGSGRNTGGDGVVRDTGKVEIVVEMSIEEDIAGRIRRGGRRIEGCLYVK